MFDKRLFSLTDGVGRLVAGKVASLWLSLLADVLFSYIVASLLAGVVQFVTGLAQGVSITVPYTTIAIMVFVLLAVCVVKYLTARSAASFGTQAAERVKVSLRERLYRKMLALGPSYSSRVRTADIVQSAGEGIDQIQSFFELFLPQLFYAVLAPITLFVVLAPVNMPSAVTLLVCAPLIVLIVGAVAMSAARVFKKYWGQYTDMGAAFLDNMQGLETLKTFDADEQAAERMDEQAERFRVMTMKVLQIQLRSLTAMDLVAYVGSAAGIGVAIWQYATGALGLDGALLVVLLSASFFVPLRQLGSYFHVAMNGMTSTKRIFALLDAPEPEHGSATLPDDVAGVTVTLRHVGYQYPQADDVMNGDESRADAAVTDADGADADAAPDATAGTAMALRDVSFTARPGTLTAIVGESGSGKSTAAALLAGSIGGYRGSITLSYASTSQARQSSGAMAAASVANPDMTTNAAPAETTVELRDLDAASLVGAVAFVSARSHLFAGTLRDNLLMGAPTATDDDLWRALEQAHIADFVRSQAEGLDMPIEQGASNLSGGQRQRFAIARVLLRDCAVYVFDEATSSVDAESEAYILDTIRTLARHATVIMITHRMANAVDADQVVVFDHGDVAECGDHQTLMAADGIYANLYRTQRAVEQVSRRAGGVNAGVVHTAGGADTVLEGGQPSGATDAVDDTATDSADDSAMGTGALIRRLLGEVGPLRPYMIIACVCGIIGHLAATFLPVFGVFALFALLGQPLWGMGVTASVAAMAVCAVIRGAMRYAEQYMNHNVAFRLLALFRSKAFAAMRRLAPAKLDGKGKGDLIALITTDVELLEIFFAHTISPVVIAVVTSVVYAVALATFSPWFSVLLIVSHLLVGVLLPRLFSGSVRSLGPRLRAKSSALDDVMLDDMRGLDEIIRFGVGERRVADIVARSRSLWGERARLSERNGRFQGLGNVLVVLCSTAAVALAFVIVLFTFTPVDAGALVASVVLIVSSFGPTLALSALPANLTQTFASARRLFALMDEAPAVEETGTATPDYHGMSMESVTFAYPDSSTPPSGGTTTADAAGGTATGRPSHPVLDGVSLTVPEHGVLGVQGPSGRGKSTMLKLLMRYWDPNEGRVAMSGEDVRTVDAHHRRTVQTMLAQETYLFDGTIRDNLRLADPDASDDQLRAALDKASALTLVDSLPGGLDTPVGELGGRLSEGERQRIGLARIFLRDANLVLLDEPTSRLDAFNEAVILQSINALADERDDAILLVSHRDSTMRIADAVIHV